jgi:hypothetical protein
MRQLVITCHVWLFLGLALLSAITCHSARPMLEVVQPPLPVAVPTLQLSMTPWQGV